MDVAALAVDLDFAMRGLRARIRAESGVGTEGLSRGQLTALYRVVHEGPITTSELAAVEYVRPQSMAQTLSALEETGLIQRSSDPTDGRRVLLSGTRRGSEMVTRLLGLYALWLRETISEELDSEEQEVLAAAVKLINRLAGSPAAPTMAGRRRHVPGERR